MQKFSAILIGLTPFLTIPETLPVADRESAADSPGTKEADGADIERRLERARAVLARFPSPIDASEPEVRLAQWLNFANCYRGGWRNC